MKAATYSQRGPADAVLRVVDTADPRPQPGQVRVRMRTSGVNPTDVLARAAVEKAMPFDVLTPHHDGAGVIDAVGAGVDSGRIGERVWIYLAAADRQHGTAAQWACVPAAQAVPLADTVDDGLGASLGIPAMTAHLALFGDGPVNGSTVLVTGGAGAVGHFTIELARWAGATVVSTVSTPEKAELARKAGADHVINYRDPDTTRQIRDIAPDGVDRIVDVNLGANRTLDQEVLAPGGTVVCYAATAPTAELIVRPWMYLNATLRFLIIYRAGASTLERAAVDITAALDTGALTALPEHRFGLDEIAPAHETVEAGVTGKVMIELPE